MFLNRATQKKVSFCCCVCLHMGSANLLSFLCHSGIPVLISTGVASRMTNIMVRSSWHSKSIRYLRNMTTVSISDVALAVLLASRATDSLLQFGLGIPADEVTKLKKGTTIGAGNLGGRLP